MADYTDIEPHLEQAKNQLLIVQNILEKTNEYANKIDHIDSSTYVDNLNNLIRLIDIQLDKTPYYTDLIEKGIKS